MASRLGQMMMRKFSTSPAMKSSAGNPDAVKLWRNLTYFGALPCCALVGVYVYLEHQAEEEHHVRPEFVKREYLYIRNRRFPWGDGNHTLFHNKHVNALPEGYEED